mgnify:FL=1
MRLLLELMAALALAATPIMASDLAYVTCQNGNGVSVLDLHSGKEIAQWSVPGKPAGVAVSTNAVFTVAPDAKLVRRHDPRSGAVLAGTKLDGGPIGIAHDSNRGRLFVSDWYNARIWVLDDNVLTIIRELEVGAAPAGLALSDDGKFLASADRDANQISLFDAGSLEIMHRIPVGERPFGLRFSPDGRLFVANVGSNDVTVIDPETADIVARLPVGDRPYGVAFANDRAFVTNQYEDTVSVFAMDTLDPLGKRPTGEYPEGIDSSSNGKNIIVANWFDNTVTVIDAATLSMLNEIETCDGPRAFGEFVMGDEE